MIRSTGVAFDHYDLADEGHRESLLGLGNGVLFARAAAPEARRQDGAHYAGLYHAGVYDQSPRRVNGQDVHVAALVNLPNPFPLSFRPLGGDWLCLSAVQLKEYRHELLLDPGTTIRTIDLQDAGGRRTRLRERRFVSMARPSLVGLRWELEALNWSGSIEIRSGIDGGVGNTRVQRNRPYEGCRLRAPRWRTCGARSIALSAIVPRPARIVEVVLSTRVHGEPVHRDVRYAEHFLEDRRVCHLAPGHPLRIDKLAIVDVRPAGGPTFRLPAPEHVDFDRAASDHASAWRELWSRCPDRAQPPHLARRLKLHRFHLLQTISPHSAGLDVGLPARGLQEMYFGHVFWDDLLAMPFLSSCFPDVARSLLLYRHRRLDAARSAARSAGCRGAQFPWRSARSGEDETPPFQLNPLSGRWMPDHTRLQHHVGCAIAFNIWQYALVSGDQAFLAREGGEMLLEIARFWASRSRWDEARGRYRISGAVGPDEYHNAYPDSPTPGLDDNAYTNVMATWTLTKALELVRRLAPLQAQALRRRIALRDAELDAWEHISRRIHVPVLPDGVLEQFEGFDRLRPCPRALIESRTADERSDWLLEARHDSTDAYQITKQADVLMLMHLLSPDALSELLDRLGYRYGRDVCVRTAHYYLRRITHESSLSRVACAGAVAHHDPERSWRFFQRALDIDLADAGKSADGLHIGAMAGTLDVLQRHYLGINFDAEGLLLRPSPPRQLDRFGLRFRYRGELFEASLCGARLWLVSACGNRRGVAVRFRDQPPRVLRPGERRSWRARAGCDGEGTGVPRDSLTAARG